MLCASSSVSKVPIFSNNPIDFAAAVIRRIERPTRHTLRSLAFAAIMTDSNRATLEAKDATATPLPAYFPINLTNSSRTPSSLPAKPGEKTFVLSQIMAKMPSSPTAFKALESTGSPICGASSIFQSPVCRIVPSSVRIAKALGSAIE